MYVCMYPEIQRNDTSLRGPYSHPAIRPSNVWSRSTETVFGFGRRSVGGGRVRPDVYGRTREAGWKRGTRIRGGSGGSGMHSWSAGRLSERGWTATTEAGRETASDIPCMRRTAVSLPRLGPAHANYSTHIASRGSRSGAGRSADTDDGEVGGRLRQPCTIVLPVSVWGGGCDDDDRLACCRAQGCGYLRARSGRRRSAAGPCLLGVDVL